MRYPQLFATLAIENKLEQGINKENTSYLNSLSSVIDTILSGIVLKTHFNMTFNLAHVVFTQERCQRREEMLVVCRNYDSAAFERYTFLESESSRQSGYQILNSGRYYVS